LLWLFGDGVSQTICSDWPWIAIFPISASQLARITDVSHWHCAPCFLLFAVSIHYWR
jgi:hypothetical protein